MNKIKDGRTRQYDKLERSAYRDKNKDRQGECVSLLVEEHNNFGRWNKVHSKSKYDAKCNRRISKHYCSLLTRLDRPE